MEMGKEKSDQNAVAELTREGLYKENKWLWEENKKLKEELEHKNHKMETLIVSIEGDLGILSNTSAEEVFDKLNNLGISKINDKVFLGLDFLTEIRDSKIVFKKIDKKWEKFLLY